MPGVLTSSWGTPQNCASSTRQRTTRKSSASLLAMLHPSPSMRPLDRHFPPGGPGITAPGSTTLAASSENAPGTFSQTIQRGRTCSAVRPRNLSAWRNSLIIRICSMYRPERSPASPSRFPATLRSWHGLPPTATSTGWMAHPRILVISPKCSISYPDSAPKCLVALPSNSL